MWVLRGNLQHCTLATVNKCIKELNSEISLGKSGSLSGKVVR